MNNVDYAATYFKYPVLCPLNGEPSSKSLKQLKTELRAKNSSVDTDLGGGDHGYLGLFLIDVEYAQKNMIPTPFVAPDFLDVVTIDALATAVKAVHAKEFHKENTRIKG